jgi:membrane fusion protein (multidrug efflux system)
MTSCQPTQRRATRDAALLMTQCQRPRLRAPMCFVSVVCVSLTMVAACGGSHSEEEVTASAPVPVTTQPVTRGTVESVVSATGLIAAAPGAELIVIAPLPARIAEMPKAEGDRVKKGDLLVEFDIPTSQADVAKTESDLATARARLSNAKAAQTRLQGLLEHGVAARKEVEDATRDVAEQEAAVKAAEVSRAASERVAARTKVIAPFNGIVGKRFHNPGDLVDAAATDPVLRVIDPARAEVSVAVPAGVANRVKPGQQARIRAASAPAAEEFWPASVLTRPTVVDPATATASARVTLKPVHGDTPPPPPIGTPVRVEIVTDVHADALTIPSSALVREDKDTVVYVVGSDKKAHRKEVTVGVASEAGIEIVKGLSLGEQVIVRGQEALPDGAAVRTGEAPEGDKDKGKDSKADKDDKKDSKDEKEK